MAAKGDVELIIRAKNDASKNLDAINKSLKELSDRQAIVGDTSGKANSQLSRLGLELARLQANAQNLKALSSIAEVMDKATSAMARQRAEAANTAAEHARLAASQKELEASSKSAAAALKTASTELKAQETATKGAKSALGDLNKETTALGNAETSLNSKLASAAAALAKQQEALAKAAQKQEALAAAIAGTDKVTKTQQNSLDAANSALERRRKAVDDTISREAALRAQLEQNKAAQRANADAVTAATAALGEQSALSAKARNELAGLKTQADSLARAERDIVRDITAAAAAEDKQAASLRAAQAEMAKLQAASDAARAAVAGSTAGTNEAATAANRAAVQVATFAARLAMLAGAAGQKTSNPLGVDPAAIRAADGAVRELGVTIRAAGNAATQASVSGAELTAALKGVGTAQAALKGSSTAITSQKAAVDGASAAWKAAEAEVKRLAIAIKASGQPSVELATALGKAQGAARLAKDEFLRQQAAAGTLATSLQQAGLGAGTLASAEAALAPRIQQVNDLMTKGQAAAQSMAGAANAAGNAAGSAEPKVSRLANALAAMAGAAAKAGAATNPLSRFKTELLGVVAASAGLYGIKTQLESIWQAGVDLAATQIRFNVAFDGVEEGTKELAYAREVALNLKLPLNTASKAYGELALAAKGGALEGENARKIFIGFSQAARVTGASAEDTKGVFKALTQIISKGKVQAEELRQQLGDRLPGAMQLMATGLGVTTAELDKMMKKGELTSETLLNMSATMSQRMAPQLAAALDSPAAKLQDFQNRMTMFKETVAGSGFLDAVGDAFDKLAKALSTPEAIQAAKDLGQALADIVTWATELATGGHLDEIWTALKTLGAVWVGLQMASIISSLYGFSAAIGATAIAALGLDIALAPVLVGLGALAAVVATVVGAFALWKLAEWAYDNFPAFAEGVLSIKNAALQSWDGIMQAWELTAVRLKNSFAKVTASIADMWYGMLDKVVNAFPELNAKLGIDGFASDIAKRAADAAAALKSNEENLNSSLDEIRARYAGKEKERQQQLQDDIAGYYKARIAQEQANSGQIDPSKVRGGKAIGDTMGSTSLGAGTETVTADPYKPSTANAEAAAAKKAAAARLALEKSVADQMFTIRSQLEKKSAETVDEQVAAVASKYAKLYGQLTALGKDRNSEEWKTVDALVAQEGANIRATAAKKAAAAAAKQERADTAAETKSRKEGMEYINTLLQTRKNIQEQIKRAEETGDTVAVEALKANLVTVTGQANEAVAGMLAFWQSVGGPEADAAIAKLEAAKLTLTKVKDEGILTGQNIGKSFANTAKSGVDSFIDKVAETGDVFGSAKEAFREFAIDFLKQIAKMILQQALFNALKATLGAIGGGGAIGSGISSVMASQLHSGGTAGAPGTGGSQARSVHPGIFANAVRFHGGGVPGLKSNEVPAVLEAGEVVRTEQQEKALAANMASKGGNAPAEPTTIINAIDMESAYAAASNSSAMGKTVLNHIRLNKSSIKQMLG